MEMAAEGSNSSSAPYYYSELVKKELMSSMSNQQTLAQLDESNNIISNLSSTSSANPLRSPPSPLEVSGMWRPWRKSTDNENLRYTIPNVPCVQCEASSISSSSMDTYTALTPKNAISGLSIDNDHPINHRHSLTLEPVTAKSDCDSLSDDEVLSNTGSDCHRSRRYYEAAESLSPLVYHPLDGSFPLSHEMSSQSIPTLPVASPEVLNFVKRRDLDRLVDRIESYNFNGMSMVSPGVPQTMIDNETTELFVPNDENVHSRQSSMPINCCDGLTLLSALAEQRALEEESRLESERIYPYPYTADFRPSDLLMYQYPMTTTRKPTLEPPDQTHSIVERPISTSSTDFNMKEDEVCSDEPLFKSPIPTTSPPPPPSVTTSPDLSYSTTSTSPPNRPVDLINSSALSSPAKTPVETTENAKVSPVTSATIKSKSAIPMATSPSPSNSRSDTQLPLKKRKRKSFCCSSNEYNFKRRSERLFVLESYSLSGIQPPDARKELFEKTPPKSKKVPRRESTESSSSEHSSVPINTTSSSPPMSSSNSNKPTSNSRSSSSPLTDKDSCHQPEVNKQDVNFDAKSEDRGEEPIKTDKRRKCRKMEAKNNVDPTNKSNVMHTKPDKKNRAYQKRQNTKSKNRSNNVNSKFLPENEEWSWSGPGIKKVTRKPKSKKTFYQQIIRGNELIKIGDCAVFFSRSKPNLPYVGRIDSMWQSGNGSMNVRLKWFYHPEETRSKPNLKDLKGALFESRHYDQNDVRTILHKCSVLPWSQYQSRIKENPELNENSGTSPKLYYLAGYYDPVNGKVQVSSEIPLKDA